MNLSGSKIRIQVFTLSVAFVLLALKFVAYWITGSNTVLSDAAESVVNVLTASFGLYSLILAAKPRDADHPYGHGKIEFVSGSLEGGLMIFAGILIVGKAAYNFFRPADIQELDLGFMIILATSIINYGMGFIAEREGKKNRSLTLVASGKHLKSDAYSTVGILLGLLLIMLTGLDWMDNLVAIAAGAFIVYSGAGIMKKAIAGIMDEADFQLLQEVIAHLAKSRKEEWVDIHNLRIIKYGDSIHIDCHATIPWYLNVHEAHDIIEDIEEHINEVLPNNLESFIHADPCIEDCCSICLLKNCPERKRPFQKEVPWNLQNVMQNRKHALDLLQKELGGNDL